MTYIVARAVSRIWLQARRIGDPRGFIINPIRRRRVLHGFFDSKTRSRISGGALHATTGVVRHLLSLQCFQHARGSRIRYFKLHGIPSCGLNPMLSAPMKMPDPNQC